MFLICRDNDKIGVKTIAKMDFLNISLNYLKTKYNINTDDYELYDNVNGLREFIKNNDIKTENIIGAPTVKAKILGHGTADQNARRREYYAKNKNLYKEMNRKSYLKRKTSI